jgi:hypothetical protein
MAIVLKSASSDINNYELLLQNGLTIRDTSYTPPSKPCLHGMNVPKLKKAPNLETIEIHLLTFPPFVTLQPYSKIYTFLFPHQSTDNIP